MKITLPMSSMQGGEVRFANKGIVVTLSLERWEALLKPTEIEVTVKYA